jgi:hypothetical protein
MSPPSSDSKNKTRNKPASSGCYLLQADFFLGLFCGPEDESGMFLPSNG